MKIYAYTIDENTIGFDDQKCDMCFVTFFLFSPKYIFLMFIFNTIISKNHCITVVNTVSKTIYIYFVQNIFSSFNVLSRRN